MGTDKCYDHPDYSEQDAAPAQITWNLAAHDSPSPEQTVDIAFVVPRAPKKWPVQDEWR